MFFRYIGSNETYRARHDDRPSAKVERSRLGEEHSPFAGSGQWRGHARRAAAAMIRRSIGGRSVRPVGLGCMNLSHAYGTPPDRVEGARLLHAALDAGYDFLDTAALYGFGGNETLIGETLAGRRGEYLLASKCGMAGVDGKRVIDGRPATIVATVEASLRRLNTDVIDLLYLHRRDFAVPIEETVGAMAGLVRAGKVQMIGLSEISAATLRAAHAVHPITAVQSEYSLWSREVELGVLDTCAQIGAAFVAFSPLGRGLLSGAVGADTALERGDIRAGMPRFQGEARLHNAKLAGQLAALATEAHCTPAQLCLAWVLARDNHVLAIPGTTGQQHAADNLAAGDLVLDDAVLAAADAIFAGGAAMGERYPAATYTEIDTERS